MMVVAAPPLNMDEHSAIADFSSAVFRYRSLFVERDILASEILNDVKRPVVLGKEQRQTSIIVGRDSKAEVESAKAIDIVQPTFAKTVFGRFKSWKYINDRLDLLNSSGLFDAAWYLEQYPDVAAAGAEPRRHFLLHGTYEKRDPGPSFSTVGYFILHPDVARVKMEPWLHYAMHGRDESRQTISVSEVEQGSFPPSRNGTGDADVIVQNLEFTFRGLLDDVSIDHVGGWIKCVQNPNAPVTLSTFIDGVFVGRTYSRVQRQDLGRYGIGPSNVGFRQFVPKRLRLSAKSLSVKSKINDRYYLFREIIRGSYAERNENCTPTIFLDLSDLLLYMSRHRALSGIQRVQVGFVVGLLSVQKDGLSIKLCARKDANSFYLEVEDSMFLSAIDVLHSRADCNTWNGAVNRLRTGLENQIEIAHGDILLTLGAPWVIENHDVAVWVAKKKFGARFVQLIHDVIPIARPEMVDAAVIPGYAKSLAMTIFYADYIFTNSEYTSSELARHASDVGLRIPRISKVEFGEMVTTLDEMSTSSLGGRPSLNGLEQEFILSVGTIEPRKNHYLLYKVWERLIRKRGSLTVPQLVLVGRIGWYVEDFMRMLRTTNFLGGKIILVQNLSDAELHWLYSNCLFTVFPSHYEGWGLPITESHCYQKVCVCSNTSSMPEAGREFAVYIDPDDILGAFRVIEELIDNKQKRKALECALHRQYTPITWNEAAVSLYEGLRKAFLNGEEKPSRSINDRSEIATPAKKGVDSNRPLIFVINNLYVFESFSSTGSALDQLTGFSRQFLLVEALKGTNWFEIESDRCWSCGKRADLVLPVEDGLSTNTVALEVCRPDHYDSEICEVSCNGESIGAFRATESELLVVFELPSSCRRFEEIAIALAFDCTKYPALTCEDNRLLGIGLKSIFLSDLGREQVLDAWKSAAAKRGIVSLPNLRFMQSRKMLVH
jgi:glycosyltransferase involved in cell wall biosynthesis